MELFRIEGFVEDKNLARVKRALMGLVLELKDAPVVNATKGANGKVKAVTNGEAISMLADWCRKHKLKTVTKHNLTEFAVSIGRTGTNSFAYLARKGMEYGLLTKAGSGVHTHYKVGSVVKVPKKKATKR